jgi:hypothetical protein
MQLCFAFVLFFTHKGQNNCNMHCKWIHVAQHFVQWLASGVDTCDSATGEAAAW